ncbi:MAG: O-antigen ligase family protein [Chitinophagaceae bacterium]|nr:O-antigen ligase family protein [Chitinophagaceae bacterium]
MILKFAQHKSSPFLIGAMLFLGCLILAFISQNLLLMAMPFGLLAIVFFLTDLRIPFYLLMFSLPLSFNLMGMIGVGLDFPDEPLMLTMTAIFPFFILTQNRSTGFIDTLKHPLILLILFSFVWTIISVVFSLDPIFSTKFLVKKIWYLVPFLFFPLLLFQDRALMIRAWKLILICLCILTLIILYRFSKVGFRFEEVHDPLQPFFMNHVMYGGMVSICVPLAMAGLWLNKRFSINWWMVLAAISILLLGVYFSYSRAAWAGVIFAAIALVLIRFKLMPWAMLGFYAVVLSAVLWLSNHNQYLNYKPNFEKTVMHESLEDHIMATIQGTDISSAERYYRWIAALRMSEDHPLTGVGPNNFYDQYKAYTITSFKTWVSRNPERSTTHNYFLFMLVEQGYPAMILYAALIFAIFFYGQRLYHRLEHRTAKVIVMASLTCIASVFVNNFFSELLETDKIGSIFFLCIAALVLTDLQQKKYPSKGIA